MTKYKTIAKNGSLYFIITEGQFKDITYKYKTLNESGNIDFEITKNSKKITEDNKFLFRKEIRDILEDKLKKCGK